MRHGGGGLGGLLAQGEARNFFIPLISVHFRRFGGVGWGLSWAGGAPGCLGSRGMQGEARNFFIPLISAHFRSFPLISAVWGSWVGDCPGPGERLSVWVRGACLVRPEISLFHSFPFISAVLGELGWDCPGPGERLGVWVRGACFVFFVFPDIGIHGASVAVLNWPGRPWGGALSWTFIIVRVF